MLLFIVIFAVFKDVFSATCPVGFAPVNRSILRLNGMESPLSWHDIDWQCTTQFPGFEMLKREFTNLTRAEKELCGNETVPLGLQKTNGGPITWRGAYDLPDEAFVSGMHRNDEIREIISPTIFYTPKRRRNKIGTTEWRGALNLTSNKWWPVDIETKFRCALCQRARRAQLNSFWAKHLRRPKRSNKAYSMDVLTITDNISTVQQLVDVMQEKFNRSGIVVIDKNSTIALSNARQYSVRLKSNKKLDVGAVMSLFSGELNISSWQNKDNCPPFSSDLLNSEEKSIGSVVSGNLPGGSRKISRDCIANVREDGDLDAVWGPTLQWIDVEQRCSTERLENVARSLEEYENSLNALNTKYNLTALADITSVILGLNYQLNKDGLQTRRSILQTLENILKTLYQKDKTNSTNACVKTSCIFLNSDEHMKSERREAQNAQKRFLFSYGEKPKHSYSKRLESSKTSHQIAVEFSLQDKLNESVALQALQDDGDVPFMQPREGKWFAYQMAVFMVVAMPNSATSFNVRIIRETSRTLSYKDHWAVWNLDEQVLGNSTCLMVSSNIQFNLYRCAQSAIGPQKFSTGKYVVYSGLNLFLDKGQLLLADVNAAADLIHRYTDLTLDRPMLEVVGEIADYVVGMDFGKAGHYTTRRIQSDLENIFSGKNLEARDDFFVFYKDRLKVLISRRPAIGMSVSTNETDGKEIQSIQTIHCLNKWPNISRHSRFDIALECHDILNVESVSFLLFNEFKNFYLPGSIDPGRNEALLGVQVTVSSKSDQAFFDIFVNPEDDASDSQPFHSIQEKKEGIYDILSSSVEVDVHDDDDDGDDDGGSGSGSDETLDLNFYDDDLEFPEKETSSEENDNNNKGPYMSANRKILIVYWSDSDNNWSSNLCNIRKLTYKQKSVFRCRIPLKEQVLKGNVFTGRYFIYKVHHFIDYLNTTLQVVLIVIAILSAISILSITASAIALRYWRQDVGHKVLLQMSIALSLNLALCFYTTLYSADTASNHCVVVGAFRHYSYLAMFAWMLTMSGLQLWRLLTIFGARNTSRLLLKLSVVAWGVPLTVVGSLLAYDINIYKSVAEDRGFCYPENTAFNVFVQGPAALILLLNLIIFVVILLRVYSFLGWGETKDLRRHVDMNSQQKLRLQTVFFTFCLFGLTWVFHLLAEQGLFKQKFIYEYMFLVTASLHLFLLSCIFVWFNKSTRRDWATFWRNVWRARTGSLNDWRVSYRREQIAFNFYSKTNSEK